MLLILLLLLLLLVILNILSLAPPEVKNVAYDDDEWGDDDWGGGGTSWGGGDWGHRGLQACINMSRTQENVQRIHRPPQSYAGMSFSNEVL